VTLVQPRRNTAALAAISNPVLAMGELGLETDTGKEKRGDGVTHWVDLPYKPTAADVAKMVPRWAPATVYVLGQQVVSPGNDVVSANVAHTSSAAYATDLAKWNPSSTYVSGLILPAPSGGDDRAACQAVINTAAVFGANVVAKAGVYLLNLVSHPITAGYSYGLTLPAGVRLIGAGKSATTFRLIANQTVGVDTQGIAIIGNLTLTGGDENVEVADLTIDGNGANQTKLHNGLVFVRARGCKATRVRVMNVKGTGNAPPTETFHFETQLGIDTTFTDCEAIGNAGTQGSGFSANQATNPKWVGCTSFGMSAGMGFTCWQSTNPSWSACNAYKNGTHGFNVEESLAPIFTGCSAGGQGALGSTPYPYAAGTSLGNTGSGFCVNGSHNALLTSCSATKNVSAGLTTPLGSGAYGACSGRAVGCNFSDNAYGVTISDAATAQLWYFASDTLVTGNTTAQYGLPTGNLVTSAEIGRWLSPSPTLPASGTALTNPYPFGVTVYLTGGTISLLRIDGADLDTTTKTVHLAPGHAIGVWYSAAPTWLWVMD
jgi:hypothetical protein